MWVGFYAEKTSNWAMHKRVGMLSMYTMGVVGLTVGVGELGGL